MTSRYPIVRKVIVLGLASSMIFGLSGCFSKDDNADPLMSQSKEELVSYIHTLETEANTNSERVLELEELLKGVQGEERTTSAITQFSDGTGRLTLGTDENGIIQLPAPFEYPNSLQASNSSSVAITDAITIKPSSNWVMKLVGTELQLEHSSGISGTISVGAIDKTKPRVRVEELGDAINLFFQSMPPETVKLNRIYLKKSWTGTDAIAHTFVDQSDAMIRCGLISSGDTCISYMFSYLGEQDAAKDELILTLLQTIKIGAQELRVE